MKRFERIMTRDPIACLPGDALAAAEERMRSADVGALPVVEGEEGRLDGIIAHAALATRVRDRDLVAQLLEEISEPAGAAVPR